MLLANLFYEVLNYFCFVFYPVLSDNEKTRKPSIRSQLTDSNLQLKYTFNQKVFVCGRRSFRTILLRQNKKNQIKLYYPFKGNPGSHHNLNNVAWEETFL